jgi:DNA polymerase-3 subunit delta
VQAVVGEDTYLAEEALERLLDAAVGDRREDAVQVLYGDEKKWANVLAAARTGSLFVSRRAIVVRRADLFAEDRPTQEDRATKKDANGGAGEGGGETGGRRKATKRESPPREHPLVEYLADPNPDVTLILVAARPDRRRNPWARLPKDAVHDATPRRGRALRAHVEEELRRRRLRFAPDALEELLGAVGQDLRRLMGEVDKVEAFAGERREISLEDVTAVLGRGLEQPLYRLSDAFSLRDTPGSVALVEDLLSDKTEEDRKADSLRILSTLHRTLRQVRAAGAMREAGTPRAAIGERLLPPNMQFKLDALLDASRRWSEPDLRRALAAVGRADRRLKRGADAATTLVATAAECGRGGAAATSPRRGR